MDQNLFSAPLDLHQVHLTDPFWAVQQQKILSKVIPYQWEALNDRIPGASKSGCIHNFRVAAGQESGPHIGCVFQDSDLAKWLEAVAYALTLKPDAELEKTADEAIELLCAAQQPDGYLDTYYIINGLDKRFTNLRDNHELYCFGHLLEAAIAYYQATGKDAFLKAMIRYADCIDRLIGPEEGKIHGYPGHEVAEMALAKLYMLTKDEKHLHLAQYFINERGKAPLFFQSEGEKYGNEMYWKNAHFGFQYYQAGKPVREQHDAEGHAVRATYLCSGIADIARLTQDESLYNAALDLWNSMTKKRMYVTGAIGSSEVGESFTFDYDLPNDRVYGETCAAIGLVFFARRMLELSPKAEYADVMERALYNGVISGISLDGTKFFYVNPLEVVPEACEKDEQKRHVKPERQKWFGCACCPPNIARLLASLGHYVLTASEKCLFMHLYIASEIDTALGGSKLHLSTEADLTRSGNVKIRIKDGQAQGTIALRIPGWCRKYTLLVNKKEPECEIRDGYVYIDRLWQANDEIELCLDMPVTLVAANPLVRDDIGQAAVTRGPLVYCVEEKDNGKNLHLLRLGLNAEFSEKYRADLLDGVTVIKAEGKKISDAWDSGELYAPASQRTLSPQTLTFIPYYAWANRGLGEMRVWVHLSEE